jgi:gamma-glutamylcyclotransferase (GGCT)/AIG2-like uncharacterized protein YtfP
VNEKDILQLIDGANRGRATLVDDTPAAEFVLDEAFGCSQRLVSYGSLQPGGSNHDRLAGCEGVWTAVEVPGRLTTREYAAFSYDTGAPPVPMQMFTSSDLAARWPELDAFEGPGYRRILVAVYRKKKMLAVANLYAAVDPV